VLATTDGGATWSGEAVPSSVGVLRGIACPSTSDCYAVGDGVHTEAEIVATTDGGATWEAETPPTGAGQLWAIACPSVDVCYAAVSTPEPGNGNIVATSDGGATWTTQSVPSDVGILNGITCPTIDDCYAVGAGNVGSSGGVVLATTNAGTTWTSQLVAPDLEFLYGITCPTINHCYTVGKGVGNPPNSDGGAVLATTDGGVTWVSQTVPPDVDFLYGVACPTTNDCTISGTTFDNDSPNGAVLDTLDGGTTWTEQALPAPSSFLRGLACPEAGECIADGAGGPLDGGVIFTFGAKAGSPVLPDATVGSPYSASLGSSGGTPPYTWRLVHGSLPPGLSLDARDGVISGTSTKSGHWSFTVRVTDATGLIATARTSISVTQAQPPQ